MTNVAALIPAAGGGHRLGLGPKAFVSLAGVTLLERSLTLLAPFVEQLVVAVPEGFEEDARKIAVRASAAASQPVTSLVVPGGPTRQATVERLLAATNAELILVHDAARPLTPAAVVARVLEAAREHGAATAVLPVADTLHDAERDVPVPRDALRSVQTPQGFAREILEEAHEAAHRASYTATDDAQLVRAIGRPVALVAGSPWSHKLTGPEDLAWLDRLARAATAG